MIDHSLIKIKKSDLELKYGSLIEPPDKPFVFSVLFHFLEYGLQPFFYATPKAESLKILVQSFYKPHFESESKKLISFASMPQSNTYDSLAEHQPLGYKAYPVAMGATTRSPERIRGWGPAFEFATEKFWVHIPPQTSNLEKEASFILQPAIWLKRKKEERDPLNIHLTLFTPDQMIP